LTGSAVLFAISFIFLFLGMTRQPGVYDEALMLTGAMRVAAGEVPFRDFYAIYGPAEFYILAGLFKLFGPSILVERLFDLTVEALTVAVVYGIVRQHAIYGMEMTFGSAVLAVCLLNLVATALLLPIFVGTFARKRLFAAGAVAALSLLFRIDTGVGLAGTQLCLLGAAAFMSGGGTMSRLRSLRSTAAFYFAGFGLILLPPAVYFLAVSPFYPLLRDVVILQSRYYHRYRNLPFPGLHLSSFENVGVYLPLVIVVISISALTFARVRFPARTDPGESQNWVGVVLSFGSLAAVMYLKGLVRTGLFATYLSMIPSMVVTAVLLEQKRLPRVLRVASALVAVLYIGAAANTALHETKVLRTQRTIPGRIIRVLFSPAGTETGFEAEWCSTENPLTRGFCFISDEGRLKTALFIKSHTRPDQRILEGVPRHDRVFANDNLIYFASGRLPATGWSEYDAGVVSSQEVQAEMVRELEVNAPPYLVLDSEFANANEPNESSKSSGIFLLDDYIHNHYQPVQTFDEMSVWQRNAKISTGTGPAR
jgi:hypothetical protein